MKNISALIILFVVFSMTAQNDSSYTKPPFIRVYDLNGEKFTKGKIEKITETTIFFKKTEKNVHFKEIGYIRLNRAAGHDIGMGAAYVGGMFGTIALFGSLNSNDDHSHSSSNSIDLFSEPEEQIAFAMVVGGLLGVIGGGLVTLSKSKQKFNINGDHTNFKAFREFLMEANINPEIFNLSIFDNPTEDLITRRAQLPTFGYW